MHRTVAWVMPTTVFASDWTRLTCAVGPKISWTKFPSRLGCIFAASIPVPSQPFVQAAVPGIVQSFAQILQTLMQATASAPTRRQPADDALRTFEDAIGRGRLDDRVVQKDHAGEAWVDVLGLTLPCSVADIKRAFRRVALATHPDRPCGSHEAFLAAQAALRRALEAVEHARCARTMPMTHRNGYAAARPSRATGSLLTYA